MDELTVQEYLDLLGTRTSRTVGVLPSDSPMGCIELHPRRILECRKCGREIRRAVGSFAVYCKKCGRAKSRRSLFR